MELEDKIKSLIVDFLKVNEESITCYNNCSGKKEEIDELYKYKIYNEFSLQHELGLYLRKNLDNAIVLFEKNVKCFYGWDNCECWKKFEIDIVILNKKNTNDKYAIELKFPINGQYPEQMFQFIKDIKFMEQVREHLCFKNTFCLALVNDSGFCSDTSMKNRNIEIDGKTKSGIDKLYKYFRKGDNNNSITKTIINPIKHNNNIENEKLSIQGDYKIKWEPLGGNNSYKKYYLLDIDSLNP